jgi:hypothetical protein
MIEESHDADYVLITHQHYGCIVGKQHDGQAFADLVKSPIKVVEKIQYFGKG